MAEYIEREATIELLRSLGSRDYRREKGTIQEAIKMVSSSEYTPAADVAPEVHGLWIKDNNSLQTDDYYCCYFDYNCSECGKVVNNRYELPKYCPNCGAKMDGGAD